MWNPHWRLCDDERENSKTILTVALCREWIDPKNQNDCKKRQNENQTEYNPESASDSFCIPPSLWNLFTLSYQN